MTPAPSQRITDPRFRYTPSHQTNILARFRALGWVPPTEQRRRC